MDTIDKERRSWNMSRIKSKHTNPELLVRKQLTKAGFRYRLHNVKLPGKPDIVLRKYNTVIFVNGCFWHQHPGCKRASIPKSNPEYWIPKLERNVEKQNQNIHELAKLGWKVIIIWECEVLQIDKIACIIKNEIINDSLKIFKENL